MLTKRRVIAAKIEASEGTGETLSASDGGILAIEPKVEVDIKMNPRDPVMATLSKLADVPGAQLARVTFKAELKGAGSAYSTSNLPALSPYLRACGMSETVGHGRGRESHVQAGKLGSSHDHDRMLRRRRDQARDRGAR